MRSIKIFSGAAILGLFVWACSSGTDSSLLDDTTDGDGGTTKDSTPSGDDSTGDDDATIAEDATVSEDDAATGSDSSVVDSGIADAKSDASITDAGADAKADAAVVDSGIVDSGVADSGVYYTIGGTLSNLQIGAGSQVVLQNNATGDLTLSANGAFTFTNKVAPGGAYAVTVKTQPTTPPQTCLVTNGSGTASANVSNVAVSCSKNSYNVGGSVTGLRGTVVVQNNLGDDKSLTTNVAYTFPTKVTTGLTYSATIKTQPDGQWCKIANSAGTVGAADVTNANVSCVEATNCQAIHAFDATAPSGIYNIDTDSAGATPSLGMYCDMTTSGGGWTQVFDHDASKPANAFMPIANWASLNTNSPNAGYYSILNRISSLKSGANFDFYMTWPESANADIKGAYVQWTQVQDPTATTDPTAVTVSNLVQSPTAQVGIGNFSGLAKKAASAYLSGERSAYWFWAIGSAASYGPSSGVPAFASSSKGTTGGANATRVQLYVR